MSLPALPLPVEDRTPFDPPPECAGLRAGPDLAATATEEHVRYLGAHACVGQQIARRERTTVLGALARRVPALRIAVPLDEIVWKKDSVVRGPAELPVAWS